MTRETAFFLRQLCNQVKLDASAPGFRESATGLIQAMDELDAELGEGPSSE